MGTVKTIWRLKIEIIPAVDIRHGKCVRLYQGDYHQETVFSDDPLEVALRWESLGATRLHIVDLDGAAAGQVVNLDIIDSIAHQVKVPVQLGGGIRSLETIARVLDLGVARVILGTVAVEQPDLVEEACRENADAVIVSIDSRGEQVATRGWLQGTQLQAVDLALSMVKLGVRRFIHTEISRDGTLSGPNYDMLKNLVQAIRQPVIAAGGISALEHLRELKRTGVEGAIIGKALYTGNINLPEALAIARLQ
jgi:phosphoribosylformimino-5-aminoimidazole carboxamide ribotide isomerase